MPITPRDTLAELAVQRASATRVFHRHKLDFCCHGQVALLDACSHKGLDVEALIAELEQEEQLSTSPPEHWNVRWDERPLDELIDHLLVRYHEPHRAELPRLIEMARKVESVHGAKASCPRGLHHYLRRLETELHLHMQKEEEVVFPLLRAGDGRAALTPVQVMEQEHRDHGDNLARLRALAHDYTPPEEACGTWRALYLGLDELERELMQHIHLENNVLFPRALRI